MTKSMNYKRVNALSLVFPICPTLHCSWSTSYYISLQFQTYICSLWRRPWRISQVFCSVCCVPKCRQLPRIWLKYFNILYFFSLERNLMGAALQQNQGWFSCAISPLPILIWSRKHVGAWKCEDAFQILSHYQKVAVWAQIRFQPLCWFVLVKYL